MSKISVSDLAKQLAEKNGLTQTEAELFVRKMFEVANEGLQSDKIVKMKWLGTFKVQSVKDRESVDVNTGERIVIEGRDKISFTPDNILKEIVNKPFAQFETVVVNDGVDFDSIDQKFEALEGTPDSNEDSVPADSCPNDFMADEDAVPTDSHESITSDSTTSDIEAIGVNVVETVDTENQVNASVDDKVVEEEHTVDSSSRISKVLENAAEEVAGVIDDTHLAQQPILDGSANFSSENPEMNLNNESDTKLGNESDSKLDEESDDKLDDKSDNKLDGESDDNDKLDQKSGRISEQNQEEKVEEVSDKEDTDSTDVEQQIGVSERTKARHVVIPKYVAVLFCLLFLILLAGMGYFAFSYGKMEAQRDHLAQQLERKNQNVKKTAPAKSASSSSAAISADENLRKKAEEDSLRMEKAANAIKTAEAADKDNKKQEAADADSRISKRHDSEDAKMPSNNDAKDNSLSEQKKLSTKYNQDPRIRTGAYRIVGVQQVVTARAGQSLATISNQYLGPGMVCYVEALNGTGALKDGQKVKIPKLELKKK